LNASDHSKAPLPAQGSLLQRLGVRGRLLLAFLGISAFAVIAAAAAMYSFDEVGKVLGRITQHRMPSALASLELSRQAERVVTAAPALLGATTRTQHQEVSRAVAAEVGRLHELLEALKGSAIAPEALAAVEPAIAGLQRNLTALDGLVAARLDVAERKEQLLRSLSGTNIATQRLVAPGVLVMDSKLAEYRRASDDPAVEEPARRAAAGELADEVAAFMPQQKAQIELSAINDTLIKAAGAQTRADLPLLAFPLRRSLATLEALANEFDAKLRPRLLERVEEFRNLTDGPESILHAREQELAIVGQGQGLLAENVLLSRQVGDALDHLVGAANQDIAAANREALAAQRWGSGVVIGMVLLSLLSSGLIVWRYVDRNLIARLTALSDSMLAIAGGNLRAPLPAAGGDEIGRMAAALTVFRDTAVEVEEKNLRELHTLLDTIDYGVLMLEPDLRIRIHNRAFRELSGMPPESFVGQPHFSEVLEHNHRRGVYGVADAEWDDYVRARLDDVRRATALATEWRLADGRVLEYRCVPLPDGGRMLTYYDLTHLKRIEEALQAAKEEAEQASRTKSEFLANMSHELRTPMNAIIGFTRLIMRRCKDLLPERQYGNLEKILASANHLLGLINDVLDLSKIEAGRMDVRPLEFALEPLIDQCLRTVEPMVRSGQVQLIKEIEPGLPTLLSDQDKLRQILFNLLSNAAKFTETGAITVEVRRRGQEIAIAVADTGIGIPPDQLELVFEEFRQVDSSSTRQYGGTGLGLSISRRLARLLGGDITLHSEPDAGSRFTLSLPIRHGGVVPCAPEQGPVAAAAAEQPDPGAPEVRSGGGRLVLAIDDDPDVVLLLKENLADAGYRVVGAASGAEGLRLARELRPNAITLDIVMPETDGWQVLHGLKADPLTRDIPVLLLSVVDQKDLGYRLGAADYLMKPFERDDLLAALQRVAPRCRSVLVVDDDPHVADLVRQSLEDEPYQIDAAADGLAALDAVRNRRPDVILLDLLMPRMDGFELIAALQQDPERRDIPVIVLTAKTLTRKERRLLDEHARAVIQKGALDRDALMAELRAALPQPVRPERREARA
jgi:signal transduction histidine kinase/CheY-like chemotaxis protein/HAMP domain-containing protein